MPRLKLDPASLNGVSFADVMPRVINRQGHGYIGETRITGLLAAGTNVTITGTGTIQSPYIVSSSGGGGGSGITRVVTVTSGNYTAASAAATDYVYLIAGAHTTTLPAAASNSNRYTFKNRHSASVTISRAGSDTVEGATSISVAPGDSIDLISDNTSAWSVI